MNISLPKLRTRTLPALILCCGIVGLIFRLLITVTAIDGKGLLIPWHPAWVCMWLMTAAAAAILILGVLPVRGPAAHKAAFPRSLYGAVGCFLAAISALMTVVNHFRSGAVSVPGILGPVLFFLQGAVFFLAVAAFVLAGLCRLFGRKTNFLFHVVICLYFALEMLDLYRTWSFDPQLHEYCFQLFACIALTAMAYQLAAFDMGRGSHRKIWAAGLAAVYLCCLAATSGLFFITGGIWAFVNLSSLRRPRQRKTVEAEVPAITE